MTNGNGSSLSRTGALAISGVSLLLMAVGQIVGLAFWAGGVRKDVLDEVRRDYLQKDNAEASWRATTAVWNSEVAIIRRDLQELRTSTAPIPRLEALVEQLVADNKSSRGDK